MSSHIIPPVCVCSKSFKTVQLYEVFLFFLPLSPRLPFVTALLQLEHIIVGLYDLNDAMLLSSTGHDKDKY